jgi:hypothetical protein
MRLGYWVELAYEENILWWLNICIGEVLQDL